MDESREVANNIFNKLDVCMNPFKEEENCTNILVFNFNKKIKLLINELIKESRNFFEGFRLLMKDVFTIAVSSSSEKTLIQEYKIGMKFQNNLPLYTYEELNDGDMSIHSPEVLRVLIKWIG